MRLGHATAVIDVLPERYPYRDEGCEISPSCLSCPLPKCKYDDPGWFQRHKQRQRDKKVASALQEEGLSVREASVRFGLSQRTIFRILRKADYLGHDLPQTG